MGYTDINSKRNGVASLLQIQARSTMETDFMYDYNSSSGLNPFFKNSYAQHTKFDRENQHVSFDSLDFGSSLIYEFDVKQFDMIGNLMLQIKLPSLPSDMLWTNDTAFTLLKEVKIVQDDQLLVSYTGEYLHLRNLLHLPSSKEIGLYEMTGHYETEMSLSNTSKRMYIDLPFLKTFNDMQYFPILLASMFKIHVVFNDISKLIIPRNVNLKVKIYAKGDGNIGVFLKNVLLDIRSIYKFDMDLMFDIITLDEYERLLFKTKSSDILFDQVQYKYVDIKKYINYQNIPLEFTNNISHLIVCMRPSQYYDDGNSFFKYEYIDKIQLILGGNDIFDGYVDASRFRYMNKCTRIPSKWIYVLPFCLDCSQQQPSGTFNFNNTEHIPHISETNMFVGSNCNPSSSPKNIQHSIKHNSLKIYRLDNIYDCVLQIYAINFNVLNIDNGFVYL